MGMDDCRCDLRIISELEKWEENVSEFDNNVFPSSKD